jgi:hypothetical protein
MKKALVFVLLGASLIAFNACKKSNLTNVWKPEAVYVNGALQELSPLGNHTLELTKDGVVILTSLGDPSIDPVEGTWEWGDNKKTLVINYPSTTPNPDNVPVIYTVIKLGSKKMWLSREYDNGTTIDIVETHYIPNEN